MRNPSRAWLGQALCAQADPEAFFPVTSQSARAALAVCRRCPVTAECLEWALEHDERFGVWDGATEGQRRRLRLAEQVSPEDVA